MRKHIIFTSRAAVLPLDNKNWKRFTKNQIEVKGKELQQADLKVVKCLNLIGHSTIAIWKVILGIRWPGKNHPKSCHFWGFSLIVNTSEPECSFPFWKENILTESEPEIRPKRFWKCAVDSHVMVRVVTVVIVLPSPLISWISEVSFPKVVPNEALVNGEVADVLSPGLAPLCASCSLADKRCSLPRAKAESL